MPTKPKRPYDATKRRERAEAERRTTTTKVTLAAQRLFLDRGYVGTTVADVAKAAGVSLQSVYNTARSKADLLHLAVDLAVAGDDTDVMLVDRSPFTAVAAESDPVRQVVMIASLIASTVERIAPLWVAYREAAAVDATAAAYLAAAHLRRRDTFRTLIGMLPEQRLRRPVETSTDCLWASGSVDLFLLFRDVQQWDIHRYEEWLRETLHDQLLTDWPPALEAHPSR